MNFSTALELLKEGDILQREAWDENLIISTQIPNTIPNEVISKMTSLRDNIKRCLAYNDLHYMNQIILVDTDSGEITYYIPTSADLFAEDWLAY